MKPNQQENYKDCGEGNGAPGRATLAMCPHCHIKHIVGQSCPTFVSSSPHQEAWAERFDNKFIFKKGIHEETWLNSSWVTPKMIKAFIRQELFTLHKADCERFRRMIEAKMVLHTHDSIPSFTARLEEGCITCIENKPYEDLLTALSTFASTDTVKEKTI